jgi:hypothetical protein
MVCDVRYVDSCTLTLTTLFPSTIVLTIMKYDACYIIFLFAFARPRLNCLQFLRTQNYQ